MATQRGILGVKKDPKNQILFSFNTRDGEMWPSDSDDSDYEPSMAEAKEADIELPRKTKRKTTKKSEQTADVFPAAKKVKVASGQQVEGLWSHQMPPELLLKIFQCITNTEGAVPIVPRLSRVCMSWAVLSRHPSLWRQVDLSYGWVKSTDNTLSWLCRNRLSRVRDLNLSSWKNLTDAGLDVVAEYCPLLESLNISYCSKVKGQAIQNLVHRCPHISRLNISSLSNDAVKPQTLKEILDRCGPNLHSLEMSGNKYTGFNAVLSVMQNGDGPGAHCRHLQVLDVSNCWFSTDFMLIHIEKLQRGLPCLRVLRLANSKFRASQVSARVMAESPGFPRLEELSTALSTNSLNGGIGIDDNFIFRLLKNSPDVRLLDLRGSSHVTTRGLRDLPITHLEQLYLTQSSVAKHHDFQVIIHKWRHSLRILDLSWNVFPDDALDVAMELLSAEPDSSCLETLNLSGTAISASGVQSILKGCPQLKTLTLTSCRGLPRGMKRDYTGRALDALRDEVDNMEVDEDD